MSPGKTNRPTLDEYYGIEANAYGHSQWMARNQIQTTERALELLESPALGGKINSSFKECIFLDIGAGTGYSSHIILSTQARVIGIDLSRDMLIQNPLHKYLSRIQADMRYIPLSKNSCDHIISISAFNFAAEGAKNEKHMQTLIQRVYRDISQILKKHGRIAIEFYPTKLQEQLFIKILKQFSFIGGMVIDDPNTRKEKKYLILTYK